ncbi:MAG: MSCRAMM family protein, partial [Terriglobales bacterium]
MTRLCAFLLLLLVIAPMAHAQGVYSPGQRSDAAAQTGDITLTGMVVNSVTGEGIPRALVQMGGMAARTALTDSSGKFQFEGLPEMQAIVAARKPGYFSDQELARGFRMKQIAITSGMGTVTITLIPAGVVTGHVTTPEGDPVEGAFVRLKAQTIVQGRKQWVERGGARADEDGAFRIANLQPGKYFLFSDGSERMMTGPPDEAFAPAYYPGVPDITGATPLHVQPGQTVNADLTLQPEKAYRVSGVVTGLQPGQMAMIRIVGSGNEFLPFQASARPDGTFEIPRIPAGAYTLKAQSQDNMVFRGGMGGGGRPLPRNPQSYTGSVPINVSGELTDITIAMQPAATIPISVRTDFSNAQANDSGALVPSPDSQKSFRQFVHVTIQRVDGTNGIGSQFDANGTMVIRDVEPGRYRVDFNPMGGNIYVQSAMYGNTDLLHDD